MEGQHIRVFHKVSTTQECQYCQLCFSCATRKELDLLEPCVANKEGNCKYMGIYSWQQCQYCQFFGICEKPCRLHWSHTSGIRTYQGGGLRTRTSKEYEESTVYSCTMRRESWTITFPKELVKCLFCCKCPGIAVALYSNGSQISFCQ